MSTVKGTERTLAILLRAETNSPVGISSPSGYPSDTIIPALEVATAGKPESSKTLALGTSQALGRISTFFLSCSPRNLSAFSACELKASTTAALALISLRRIDSFTDWNSFGRPAGEPGEG